MKTALGLAALAVAAASLSHAASCGTIGSPTACAITVGGVNTFTVTNFNLVNAAATGGGFEYGADDINIDIASGGGLSLLLTFSKNSNGPTPGIVFLVNPGETSGFIFSYDIALSTAVPGTASFIDPVSHSMASSSSGNGSATVQLAMNAAPICFVTQSQQTNNNCALAAGVTNALTPGNIVTMSANTGNASILSMSNLFQSSFTADPQPSVPEPSSFVLLGFGLVALRFTRR